MILAVIGGEPLPSALDGVVALLGADDRVVCSGVLLGRRHVLTAAHCAGLGDRVAWGRDLVDGRPVDERGVASATVADGWTEGDHDLDLAVLELDEDAPAAPWPLAEAPPEVGAELSIYGFGVTAETGEDPGHKRGASLEVLEVDPSTLLSWSASANACSGDSGGPAVARTDGGWAVIGVDTWVDPACLGGETGTTRADVRDAWLGDLIPDLSRTPVVAPEPRGAPTGCAHAPGGAGWVVGASVALGMRKKRRTPA